jgi:tRNA threonylcarbamoyladenosine modification (KEOPS) complex Cgi121 subunit
VGQIEGLKPGKNSIILVLVGETDPALLGRLQDQFEDELDEDSDALRIVVVKQESPPPPSS